MRYSTGKHPERFQSLCLLKLALPLLELLVRLLPRPFIPIGGDEVAARSEKGLQVSHGVLVITTGTVGYTYHAYQLIAQM